MAPAGFWRRYAAWSLDAAIVAVPVLLCGWRHLSAGGARIAAAFAGLADTLVALMLQALDGELPPSALLAGVTTDPALQAAAERLLAAIGATAWPPLLGFAALGLVWHAGCEASARQATPGKRALGLSVTGLDGARLPRARALLRHAAGALSWASLNLGHVLAALPPQHRALHDHIAAARVRQAADAGRLPRWALAWIALQLLAAAAAMLWLIAAMQALLEAAFLRVPL